MMCTTACGNSNAKGKTQLSPNITQVWLNGSKRKVKLLLLETACTVLKESLVLGVMGGGPGEEEEFEEEEGGPGDTERRRSPPIWLRTWLLGLWGRKGLICVITHKETKVDTIRDWIHSSIDPSTHPLPKLLILLRAMGGGVSPAVTWQELNYTTGQKKLILWWNLIAY